MTHFKSVSVPRKAFQLPAWPESHTCEWLQENMPDSGFELAWLIIDHLKSWAGVSIVE
jgi:hypothetical protein